MILGELGCLAAILASVESCHQLSCLPDVVILGYSNAGGSDLFVIKYDSDGIKQWTQQLGSVDQENGLGITSDPSDNIYVTGWTEGRLDVDAKVGEGDAIIVKYDTDGNKQ